MSESNLRKVLDYHSKISLNHQLLQTSWKDLDKIEELLAYDGVDITNKNYGMNYLIHKRIFPDLGFIQEIIQDELNQKLLNTDWKNIEKVKLLLEIGADINVCGRDAPLLHDAIADKKHKDIEYIKYLVENGANIEAKYHGSSALHYACAFKHQEAIKYLIERGADIHTVRNDTGEGVLHELFGSGFNHLECLQILVNAAANINAIDYEGNTVLHKIIDGDNYREEYLGCIEFLVNAGCDYFLKNKIGKNALDLRDELGEEDVYQIFEKFFANKECNTLNSVINTELHEQPNPLLGF